jgi:hypothetical protein
MSPLDGEIDTFRRLLPQLEAKHKGQWVLIHHHTLIGTYQAFDAAADEAVRRFGSGPFLIRQIGARPVALPASLAYTRPRPSA